ncbi:Beige/BEACH domain containing protein [Trichomonas vaginalis G3]|uniref:Beige/BEACH domain containing protein n=1 Tax=Trichomonas vaginalis (strain ATCC PRA-98 / G3) TaxID=412133 RepID=A2D7B6_TRIV3|nr:beige/BEACH-related family [Trichomonas vaginalis G3]EAY23633.1 Beige/BEACH domain containing protein [Trichomonas vaginalis G3]KAI5490125.1 beige/BEACH-related family [Trichomonas vaginalis G3]|eukprot:XP_001276881.1 Beige/BEACH domain containing protein [Trichomonas vaginalis G3]
MKLLTCRQLCGRILIELSSVEWEKKINDKTILSALNSIPFPPIIDEKSSNISKKLEGKQELSSIFKDVGFSFPFRADLIEYIISHPELVTYIPNVHAQIVYFTYLSWIQSLEKKNSTKYSLSLLQLFLQRSSVDGFKDINMYAFYDVFIFSLSSSDLSFEKLHEINSVLIKFLTIGQPPVFMYQLIPRTVKKLSDSKNPDFSNFICSIINLKAIKKEYPDEVFLDTISILNDLLVDFNTQVVDMWCNSAPQLPPLVTLPSITSLVSGVINYVVRFGKFVSVEKNVENVIKIDDKHTFQINPDIVPNPQLVNVEITKQRYLIPTPNLVAEYLPEGMTKALDGFVRIARNSKELRDMINNAIVNFFDENKDHENWLAIYTSFLSIYRTVKCRKDFLLPYSVLIDSRIWSPEVAIDSPEHKGLAINSIRHWTLEMLMSRGIKNVREILNLCIAYPRLEEEIIYRIMDFAPKLKFNDKIVEEFTTVITYLLYFYQTCPYTNEEQEQAANGVRIALFCLLDLFISKEDKLGAFLNREEFAESFIMLIFEKGVDQYVMDKLKIYVKTADYKNSLNPCRLKFVEIAGTVFGNLNHAGMMDIAKSIIHLFVEQNISMPEMIKELASGFLLLPKNEDSANFIVDALDFLVISAESRSLTATPLAAIEEAISHVFGEPTQDLFIRLVQLLAGHPLDSAQPSFLIKQPTALTLILGVFKDTQFLLTIFDFIAKLCEYSSLNCAAAAIGGLSEMLIEFMLEWRNDETIEPRQFASCMSLLMIIVMTSCTVNVARMFISLLCPIEGRTIPHTQNLMLKVLNKMLIDGQNRPRDSLPLVPQGKYATFSSMPQSFVVVFWIFNPLSDKSPQSIIAEIGDLKILVTDYRIKVNKVKTNVELDAKIWNMVSIKVNIDDKESDVTVMVNNKEETKSNFKLPKLLFEEKQLFVIGGGTNDKNYALLGNFGIFKDTVQLDKLMKSSLRGSMENNPDCIVYMQPFQADGFIYMKSNSRVEQGKIECPPFVSFADVLVEKCGIEMILPLFAQWDMPYSTGKENTIKNDTLEILTNCLKMSSDSQKLFAEVGGFRILSHLIISSKIENIDFKLYQAMVQILNSLQDGEAKHNMLIAIIFNLQIWLKTSAVDHIMIIKHWARVIVKNYYNDCKDLLTFTHILSMLISNYWYSQAESLIHQNTERCRNEVLNVTEVRKYLFEILKQISLKNFDTNSLKSLVSHILTCGEINQCLDLINFLQYLLGDDNVWKDIEEPGKYISLLVYLFNLKSDDIVLSTLSCIVYAFRHNKMNPITMKDEVEIMLHQVGSYFSRTTLVDIFIEILNNNVPELLPLLSWMTLNNGRPIILPQILKSSKMLVTNDLWCYWPLISCYKCQEQESKDLLKYLLDCNVQGVLTNLLAAANIVGLALKEDRIKMMRNILLLASNNETYDEEYIKCAQFFLLYRERNVSKTYLETVYESSPFNNTVNNDDSGSLLMTSTSQAEIETNKPVLDEINIQITETQKEKDIKRHSLNVANLAKNVGNLSSYNSDTAESTLSYLFPVHEESNDTGKARRVSLLSVSSFSKPSRRRNISPKKMKAVIMPSEMDKKVIDIAKHPFNYIFGLNWTEDGKWEDFEIAKSYLQKYISHKLEITAESQIITSLFIKFGGDIESDYFNNTIPVMKAKKQLEDNQLSLYLSLSEDVAQSYNINLALSPIRFMHHLLKTNKRNADINFENLEQASSLASVAANEIADYEDKISTAKTHSAHLWSHLWQCMTFSHAPWSRSLPAQHSAIHYKKDMSYCGLMPLKLKKNRQFTDHKHESLVRDTGDEVTAEIKLEEYKKELALQYQKHAPSGLLDVLVEDKEEINNNLNMADQRCIMELPCELIEISRRRQGTFAILADSVVISIKEKTKVFPLEMICDVLLRTHLHHQTAIEMIMIDGRSYLINFENVDSLTVLKHFKELWLPNIANLQTSSFIDFFQSKKLTDKWVSRQISNFEYLLYLNKFSGRTFNDASQYPIMPWVLSDYTSSVLDLTDPQSYRDLSKPIGAINEERLQGLVEKMDIFSQMGITPYLYSSGPNCPLAVYLWLLRMEPCTTLHIEIQGGKFDTAARLFSSIPNAWNLCTKTQNDFRELIPEFFSTPEFLVNSNRFDLGKTQDYEVDDVVLPPWANTPYDFIYIMRKALESDYVSSHLHQWIDLIFGVTQKSSECNNIYMEEMYSTIWDNKKNLENPEVRAGIEAILMHVGQIPQQIFTKPHPQRYAHVSNASVLSKNICIDLNLPKTYAANISKRGNEYMITLLNSEGGICVRNMELTDIAKASHGSNVKPRSKSNASASSQISAPTSPHIKRNERRSNIDIVFSEPCEITLENMTTDKMQIEDFNELCSETFAIPIAGGSFAVSGRLTNEMYIAVPGGLCNKALQQRSRIVCSVCDGKYIAVANSEAVISIYRKNFEKPIFKVPSFTSAIRCMCISEKFHIIVAGTKDSSLLFISLTSGQIAKVVELDGFRAKHVIITPSWGFVAVHATKIANGMLQHQIFLISPNGDIIVKRKSDAGVESWTSESTSSGFDVIGMVDEIGNVFVFEAFYVDLGRKVFSTNTKVVSVRIDPEDNVLILILETGKSIMIPISVDL